MILKLEDYCQFTNGGSWSADEYTTSGFPVLKVSNFNSESISFDELSYLDKKGFEKYKRHKLQLHDIVIATVGSHPSLINSAAGRVIVIPHSAVGLLLNQNAVCLRTKDPSVLDQRYLGYFCKTQLFQSFIQQRGKGAANQMRIPISGIKSFEFDFPEISIQRKIAAILSAYDDLIENNLKRIELLEEQAQLIYEEWFVRMKFPGYENTVINSETGLPKGWKKGNLSDLVNFQSGFAFKSKQFKSSGYPVIKIKNINNGTVDNNFNDFINELYAKEVEKYKLYPGDLLIAMTGATVGKVGIVPITAKPCYLNQRVGRFQKKEKIDNTVYLKSFFSIGLGLQHVLNYAQGSAQPNISASEILSIESTIPSDDLLIKYSKLGNRLNKLMLSLRRQNQLLKEARDILLPRLMTGMIEV